MLSGMQIWVTIAKDIIAALAILIGGGWTLWKFVIQRESHPKIEFRLDLRVLGKFDDRILVETVAIVENKGLVRHYINDFSFDLLYLQEGDQLKVGDEKINGQVLFQKEISKKYWIPKQWYYSFIDSQVTQEYTFITSLPSNAEYALLYAQFHYPKSRGDFHTAQKTFNIKKQLN